MEIKVLTIDNKCELEELITNIEDNLENDKWWLPIQEKAYENFFNEDWTIFVGAFDNNKLVGASALFFNEFEYGESVSTLNIESDKVAEIGRCMVLPNYRGKNLMHCMNLKLIEIAKSKEIEYLIATAHPNNNPSNNSLRKIGMKFKNKINKYNDYERNIYLKKLI